MLRSIFAVIAFLGFSVSASAQGFNYNYVAVGYSQVDFDDADVDGDGFGIEGSYALNENVHLFGGYSQADFDFGIDLDSFSAGVGYNTAISQTIDFVGRLSYEYIEVSASGLGSEDDNGFGLGIGLRAKASESIELNAGIQYVDLSDSGDNTAFGIGGIFALTDTIDIGLSGDWDDDITSYTLFGRFNFGK